MHTIWWALADADPSRALAGWEKNSFPISSGRDSADRVWVLYHWGGNSGGGAATTRDGFNQMGPMITLGGLTIPNAETYERLYPSAFRSAPARTIRSPASPSIRPEKRCRNSASSSST